MDLAAAPQAQPAQLELEEAVEPPTAAEAAEGGSEEQQAAPAATASTAAAAAAAEDSWRLLQGLRDAVACLKELQPQASRFCRCL